MVEEEPIAGAGVRKHEMNMKAKVLQTLPGVTPADLQSQGGLPNPLYQSDHISIAADLQLA